MSLETTNKVALIGKTGAESDLSQCALLVPHQGKRTIYRQLA
ncbi:MAG TPA: hypothetical protein VFE53_07265 [Mucilaginibacter sp.]|jgi:hypothetical protein|nr:hypothetical protein [Mucilaginibacter sp.]